MSVTSSGLTPARPTASSGRTKSVTGKYLVHFSRWKPLSKRRLCPPPRTSQTTKAISTFSSFGAPMTSSPTGNPGEFAYRIARIEYSGPVAAGWAVATIIRKRKSSFFIGGPKSRYSRPLDEGNSGKTFRREAGRHDLQRAPRGAHEIAQNSDIRPVSADPPRVHRKPTPSGVNLNLAERPGLPVDAGPTDTYGPMVTVLRYFVRSARSPLHAL